MKKNKLLFIILLITLIIPKLVLATSGKITLSGANQVVVGNKITITVKLSTGASWEMDLNYDKNYLQLVSGGGEAGGTNMVNTSNGNSSRTYTFTFKALKSGSTSIKIGSYYVVDDSFNTVSISTSNKTIKIITQAELEASYSKDNNLKSLTVDGYDVTPTFDKNITEYSANVPEGTTSIKVKAIANDSKSDVFGTGDITVSEGINNVDIIVRAENGSEKKYTLVVNVIDTNPINVVVNDINYSLVKLRSNFACQSPFAEKEININDVSIPACYNESVNYTLVGLKDEAGNISTYIYDNGNYSLYEEVTGNALRLIILNYKDSLNNYTKGKVTINDVECNAFKYNKNSDYYVLYGINVLTGEKDFYLYDSKNNILSGFDQDYIKKINTQISIYLYIIIAFGVSLFLTIICIICINKEKNKIKKHLLETNQKEDTKKRKE